MKFLFFLFIFLLIPLSTAALSGSPSSLNFNISLGEEECQTLNIYSEDYNGIHG